MNDDYFRISYRVLSEIERDAITNIKSDANILARTISQLPQNREMALAMTRLEEAVMWATKGLTS
jgi:hypothetical protein